MICWFSESSMSGRSRVSSRVRPRTRVYDANFTIGESYYKDALDRIDRKYSGRPTSPSKQSSVPRDIKERHAEAFADEDLPTARRRAEKLITDANEFDLPKMRPMSVAIDGENGFDDEVSNEQLFSYLKNYINDVSGKYRGKRTLCYNLTE